MIVPVNKPHISIIAKTAENPNMVIKMGMETTKLEKRKNITTKKKKQANKCLNNI